MSAGVAAASFTLALMAGSAAAEDAAVVAELTKREHQFAEAALLGDLAGLEKLLDPDFIGADPRGTELMVLRVHKLSPRDGAEPSVGVEVFARFPFSVQLTGFPLTAAQASSLSHLLVQATGGSHSTGTSS